jgi:exodeoxyribonuclease VII large subunit
VQGAEAPAKIIRMLQLANRRQECDLLILSRGGGSLEDLLAFNDEAVARAIVASEIPLITGIGHEIDFTIADFVADLRAPTPSAAAEHAVPDQDEWLKRIAQLFSRLSIRSKQRIKTGQLQLEKLDQRLQRQHPRQRLTQRTLRLDELTQRLLQTQTHQLLKLNNRLQNLQFRLNQQSPILWLERLRTSIDKLGERLHRSLNDKLAKRHNQLGQLARDLDNLSPLNTLKRGYAIVSKPADGQILRSSVEIQAGELAEVRLVEGHLLCEVKETYED